MATIEVKTTEPAKVAYLDVHGSFDQIPETLGRLYSWIGEHEIHVGGMPSIVYFSMPAEGEESAAFWEARAEVDAATAVIEPDASGVGVQSVEPREVATAMHRGPYDTVIETYKELESWIPANGYHVVGPPEEVYFSDPSITLPQDYLTEVRMPVAR